MRIAIVSDIHGNLPALQAVVAHMRRYGVDQVVNLGDSLSGPLLPRETAEYLMEQGWPTLAGNHERQLLTQAPERMGLSDRYAYELLTPTVRDWLRSLPSTLQWSPDVLLCHGTPHSDVHYFLETLDGNALRLASAEEITQRLEGRQGPLGQLGPLDAASSPVIACGHTHVPRVVRAASGQLLVNPGSVGMPAYDDDVPVPHVVETGSPDARYATLECHAGQWFASLHTVPYDYHAMADLARSRGRLDWEYNLRTGYAVLP
ncbi:metallophosphoesterase family protein [Curvibacter sp. CHRR-16]|uniref:metallophosphoesterase family protein n=1 Tax=Curvibacter sp. CHRR-16 TaxID=2835872 RepID=UPI001BDA85D9|nr:metallophosphoesterase family protein [Curvibacter sp. CHRR-16]MBT0570244.1 metallophosphoesterase family protein [Curvibacter sp. CHRR-16]